MGDRKTLMQIGQKVLRDDSDWETWV